MCGDPLIVGLDRRPVLLHPALLLLRPHHRALAAFERLRDVDAHAARLVEQLGIDEKVDGALLDRALAYHRGLPGSMRKDNAHDAGRQATETGKARTESVLA